MSKLFVVIDSPIEVRKIPSLGADADVASQVAICLIDGGDGANHLALQQQTTAQLRARFGPAAETVAIFVVSGLPGDDVAACAAAWGASEVVSPQGTPWRDTR